MRPQNIGSIDFFGKNAQHSGLEGTRNCFTFGIIFEFTLPFDKSNVEWLVKNTLFTLL